MKAKLRPRLEAEALNLIRQVQSPIWHDRNWWECGERGDILLRLFKLGPITRKVWLNSTFPNPEQARLAIWTFTAEGNRILEEELSVCANLPRNGHYQDLANLVMEYAQAKGWGQTVVDGMAEDIRQAQAAQLLERLGVENESF
jgi:hypothetical protein